MRSALEVAVGLLFLIGAVFNSVYTRGHGQEFYGEWAAKAWLPPAGRAISRLVLPRTKAFTVVLVVFQALVALAILSRGDIANPALLVGGAFALVVAFFSSPGGAVANVSLAALQWALALTG